MSQPGYYAQQPYPQPTPPGYVTYNPNSGAVPAYPQPVSYAYAPQPYAQPGAAVPVYYAPQQQAAVYPVAPEAAMAKPQQHHYSGGGGAKAPTGAPAPGLASVEAGSGAPSYSEQMEKVVRMGFVRKVYSVLMVQLAVTFGIVGIFTFSEPVRNFVQSTPELLFSAIGISFVALIAMACCTSVTRTYPYNYLALAVFTLCESYLVGTIASFYKTDAVLIAVGGTVLITLGLTLFAWQTRIDFTAMSSAIFVTALSFMLFGILVAIMRSNILRIVYAAIGVLVFGLFLVYDTQLILGGKHREYSYGPDDFIIAALNVYLDIINIFLYLLRIFGSSRD